MERRIQNGEIDGVADPCKAKNIIRRGAYTYDEAKAIAKTGTIESLKFDAINGIIISTSAVGVSAVMSFELITAVNNKLNDSMIAVEKEINTIYGTMLEFFKRSRADIMRLETRVERLERNVDLLNWQNSIEYQMYNGV